jgi:hypothetical protein
LQPLREEVLYIEKTQANILQPGLFEAQ